jgi:hypothetical protein
MIQAPEEVSLLDFGACHVSRLPRRHCWRTVLAGWADSDGPWTLARRRERLMEAL